MKERRYIAKGDNGRDFVTWEFYSSHRAYSEANFKDAERHYKSLHGHGIKVLDTSLLPE